MTALAANVSAQDNATGKAVFLNARLMTRQGGLTTGYLYSLSDTALLLSSEKRLPRMYDTSTNRGIRNFGYRDLEYVTISRHGRTGRSILIGFAIGATTGALAGFASGDDPPGWFALTAGEKAFGVGLLGAGVGAITGLIIGVAGHRTFIINGKKEKFTRMSQKLASRLGIAGPASP